jgi:hypothetical protein
MMFILAYVIYVMGHFHKNLTTFHLGVILKCQFFKFYYLKPSHEWTNLKGMGINSGLFFIMFSLIRISNFIRTNWD